MLSILLLLSTIIYLQTEFFVSLFLSKIFIHQHFPLFHLSSPLHTLMNQNISLFHVFLFLGFEVFVIALVAILLFA